MIYLSNINLSQCELQNAVIQNLAAAPANPKLGQVYFNTTTGKLMVWQKNTEGTPTWTPTDGSHLPALAAATESALGGIKIGFTAAEGVKQYAVQLDSNDKAFVAVPWTDTVTRVSVAESGVTVGTDLASGDIVLGMAAQKQVTDANAAAALSTTDANLVTAKAAQFAIDYALSQLKLTQVGGDGKYIKLVSQANGQISAEADDLPTYEIEKQAIAEDGMFATYKLKKTVGASSSFVGASINIPKDYLVKSANTSVVTTEDKAEGGKFYGNDAFAVGDKYIDFTVNAKEGEGTESHIYLNVKDLAHIYTKGNGIEISADDVISAKVVAANGLSVDADGIKLAKASASQDGAMSKEYADKLDKIEDGAEVNIIEAVKVNGTALEVSPEDRSVNIVNKFEGEIVGNGTNTQFEVAHNLGTKMVQVAFYDGASFERVMIDYVVDTNKITVKFAAAPADSKTYKVVVNC